MSTWWFPDNTVLCNFAAVDRLNLLQKVLDSRLRGDGPGGHEAVLTPKSPTNRKISPADPP